MLHFNIQWKYALNVPLDYEGFDDSLLTYFRARLLTNHKEKILFRKTLELAKEAGLIKGKIDQVIDSTPILGAGAVKDTYELIRDGIKKVISLLDKKRRSGMNLSFLIEAIRTLYVDKELLGYRLIEALEKAKRLREEADYYGEFSPENAQDLLHKAEEFLQKTRDILRTK